MLIKTIYLIVTDHSCVYKITACSQQKLRNRAIVQQSVLFHQGVSLVLYKVDFLRAKYSRGNK